MKNLLSLFCILLTFTALPLRAVSDTFVDYQNFNHGYCPECNCYPCRCGHNDLLLPAEEAPDVPPTPCATCANGGVPTPNPVPGNPPVCKTCETPDPCDPAPVCATNCGVGLCWIGLGIAITATVAAIIVSSNNGRRPSH